MKKARLFLSPRTDPLLRRSSTYRHSVQQCDITNGPALIMYVNCMATTSLFKRTFDPKFVVLLHNIVLAILTK